MNRIKYIITLSLFFFAGYVQAQSPQVDSLSVYILKRMSQTMQSLGSCSFSVNTTYDVYDENAGLVKHTGEEAVYMKFPDKMKIHFNGDKGRRAIWYNQNSLVYYSYEKQQYSKISTPPTIIETIDTISKQYGIEFPAADYFYNSFVQDLIDTGGNLLYLGISPVEGKKCFHIAGKDRNGTGYQFWISDDDYFLPVKMVLVYGSEEHNPQYEAYYSNWEINPNIPDSMFECSLPPMTVSVKSKK